MASMMISATSVLADTKTATTTDITKSVTAQKGNHKGNFKTILDNLITAGTITSDEETAILNAFTNAK